MTLPHSLSSSSESDHLLAGPFVMPGDHQGESDWCMCKCKRVLRIQIRYSPRRFTHTSSLAAVPTPRASFINTN